MDNFDSGSRVTSSTADERSGSASARSNVNAGTVEWFEALLKPIGEPFGLALHEISEVQQSLGHDLPATYMAFLTVTGRGCGPLWIGSQRFYPELLSVYKDANDIAADTFVFPDGSLPIATHQGYIVEFLVGNDADPPVYTFSEGDSSAKLVATSFSTYVATSVERCLQRPLEEIEAREVIVTEVAKSLTSKTSNLSAGTLEKADILITPIAALAEGHLDQIKLFLEAYALVFGNRSPVSGNGSPFTTERFTPFEVSDQSNRATKNDEEIAYFELVSKLVSDCEILLSMREKRSNGIVSAE